MMSKCIEVYEGFRTSVYQILDHVAGQNYIAFIDQIAREYSIIPVFRGFIFAAVVCEVSLTAGRELWVVTVVDVHRIVSQSFVFQALCPRGGIFIYLTHWQNAMFSLYM